MRNPLKPEKQFGRRPGRWQQPGSHAASAARKMMPLIIKISARQLLALIAAAAALLLACEESLPPRVEPENPLVLTKMVANQGIYQAGPHMVFVIEISNLYEETFQEEVNVHGKVTVWWERKPEIRTELEVTNSHFVPPTRLTGSVLTLDPGERCALKVYWYLQLDDGSSLLDLLDYSGAVPAGGLIQSKPERFVVEAEIKLFNQLGYLQSERLGFTFIGTKSAATPD